MEKHKKRFEFEIVNGWDSIWKTPAKIETVDNNLTVCPYCCALLSVGVSLVPIGDNKKAKVNGMECRKCRILFTSRSRALRKLLLDNEHAKTMTLNGETLWNYSFSQRKKAQKKEYMRKLYPKLHILTQVEGSIMLVTLKCSNEQIDCVITNSKEPQVNIGVIATHYSSLLAREIITAVYRSPRSINFKGKECEILGVYYPRDSIGVGQRFPIEFMPDDVRIKSGGGYSTSIKSNNDEIVDLLLFSPFTQRYELARATYNRPEQKCFMDIGIYRSFVNKYGNPKIKLSFNESTACGLAFFDLRSQSILREYGYSVSESDGLTESERRELLAEIVDLGLLTISYVVGLLDFFVRTHTSDKYFLARDKWERDKEYISSYNINPKRFLIMR